MTDRLTDWWFQTLQVSTAYWDDQPDSGGLAGLPCQWTCRQGDPEVKVRTEGKKRR